MIRVLREGNPRLVNGQWVQQIDDKGEFLLSISPTSADYAVIAGPHHSAPGLYTIRTVRCSEIKLQLRTPIPLFDASHMGRLDAAETAARAASTPTEELTNERATNDPACCGG